MAAENKIYENGRIHSFRLQKGFRHKKLNTKTIMELTESYKFDWKKTVL
jgi:hypothetical protein